MSAFGEREVCHVDHGQGSCPLLNTQLDIAMGSVIIIPIRVQSHHRDENDRVKYIPVYMEKHIKFNVHTFSMKVLNLYI